MLFYLVYSSGYLAKISNGGPINRLKIFYMPRPRKYCHKKYDYFQF